MIDAFSRVFRDLIGRPSAGAHRAEESSVIALPPGGMPVDALIAELGLKADESPIRERRVWHPPRRVLVNGASQSLLEWLQPAAPTVELISVTGADVGESMVDDADAIIGWHTPGMVRRGRRLAWLQTHTADVGWALRSPEIIERGIVVTSVKRVAGPVIAEHVFAMLLCLTRRLGDYREYQIRRRWAQFRIPEGSLGTLRGKTLLLAGLGGIGAEVARLGHAFGMQTMAVTSGAAPAPPAVDAAGSTGELDTMLGMADVVVNALPHTRETEGLFDARRFARMKRGALFVNVGRGASVVTDALVDALRSGQVGAAALDVIDPEPLPPRHPLWRMRNVLITPHVAGLGQATHERIWLLIRENLRRFAAGEPMLSVVDPDRGY